MKPTLFFEEWLELERANERVKEICKRDPQVKLLPRRVRRILLTELVALLEYNQYKSIPGTQMSLRQDPANTNTKTQLHAHVFALPSGKGQELFSVNIDGTAHDSSHGVQIPKKAAKHLTSLGYRIPDNRIIESLDIGEQRIVDYSLYIIMTD